MADEPVDTPGRRATCHWWQTCGDLSPRWAVCVHAQLSPGETFGPGCARAPEDGPIVTGPRFGCVHWYARIGEGG